jgi:hypothetical protein
LLFRIWETFGTEYVHINSSQPFIFNGSTVNFGDLLNGVSLSSTYSNTPLPALPGGFSGVSAFSGHGLVVNVPAPATIKGQNEDEKRLRHDK